MKRYFIFLLTLFSIFNLSAQQDDPAPKDIEDFGKVIERIGIMMEGMDGMQMDTVIIREFGNMDDMMPFGNIEPGEMSETFEQMFKMMEEQMRLFGQDGSPFEDMDKLFEDMMIPPPDQLEDAPQDGSEPAEPAKKPKKKRKIYEL